MTAPGQRATSFARPSGMSRVVPHNRISADTAAGLGIPSECRTARPNAACTCPLSGDYREDLTTLPRVSPLLDMTSHCLMALTALLTPVVGPLSASVAIMLVTLAVRAGLIPTGIAQAKSEQMRARLAPRLRELQKRHRANPERLQRETMQLYRSEGVSPLTGSAASPGIPAGLLGLLQFATAVIATFVPLAAGIYLLTTVAWTLGQRLLLRRIYPPTAA